MATGVDNRNTRIYATSYPSVAFTDEATTTTDHKTFSITNQVKRLLDPEATIAVQISTDGGTTWATATGYTLRRVGAAVIFPTVQTGATVRLHSGNYLPYMAIAGANTAEFSSQVATQDTSGFVDNGWESTTLTVMSGTLKCHAYWQNSALIQNLIDRDLLAISYYDGDSYYEGYCWVGNSDLKSQTKGVVETDYTFNLTDQFFINS